MSTTGITTWAVDLADVGAVYPFQGWEFIMLIVGLVFWIWWHVTTFRSELAQHDHKVTTYGGAKLSEALDSND
ncbi:MAG: hypothetical protein OXB95_03160 [Rhodobacteraceae bacterium]|nr:hypothetical protein [Paracoccaceae bacterium]